MGVPVSDAITAAVAREIYERVSKNKIKFYEKVQGSVFIYIHLNVHEHLVNMNMNKWTWTWTSNVHLIFLIFAPEMLELVVIYWFQRSFQTGFPCSWTSVFMNKWTWTWTSDVHYKKVVNTEPWQKSLTAPAQQSFLSPRSARHEHREHGERGKDQRPLQSERRRRPSHHQEDPT